MWSGLLTRWAGRCGTCGSRSPTAATSAASTACRGRSSAATTRSSPARELLTFEEIDAPGPRVRRPRRREGPPHRGRAARPPRPRDAGGDARRGSRGVDLTLTTNGALLAGQAAGPEGGGAARVTVSLDSLDDDIFTRHERRRRPGRPGCSRESRLALAAGLAPVKVNVVVQARPERRRGPAPGPPLPRDRATSSASSSTWTWGTRTAGAWTTSCPPPRSWLRSTPRFPWSRWRPPTAGEVAHRCRYRDGSRRDRSGRLGDAALLRRLHARPPLGRRTGLHVPLRHHRPRPAGPAAKRCLRRGADRRDRRHLAAPRTDRYSELRSAETIDLPKVEMSLHRGLAPRLCNASHHLETGGKPNRHGR